MAKSRSKVPLAPHQGGFNNPFAALGGNPPAPAAPPVAPPPSAPESLDLRQHGKIIVRHERKGRGGKTVTLLEGLTLSPEQLDAMARQARKALGCGATVEENVVVLQGDQRERAAAFLRELGARQVR